MAPGRSDVGGVLVSMHFIEYDVVHFVRWRALGSCIAEIVAFIKCGGRGCGLEVGKSADVGHAVECRDSTCEQYVEVQKSPTRRENGGHQIEST